MSFVRPSKLLLEEVCDRKSLFGKVKLSRSYLYPIRKLGDTKMYKNPYLFTLTKLRKFQLITNEHRSFLTYSKKANNKKITKWKGQFLRKLAVYVYNLPSSSILLIVQQSSPDYYFCSGSCHYHFGVIQD